jgi:hypothetical protein
MAVFIPDRNLVFIHILKNGGTSIRSWLDHQCGGKWIAKKHSTIKEVRAHHKRDYREYSPERLEYFICCRNPYARLVSWYNFKKMEHQDRLGKPLSARDESMTHEKALVHYGDSFKEWLRNIDFEKPIGYNYDWGIIQPQVSFIDAKPPKWILRTETLDEDFKQVQKYLNCYEPLVTKNKSDKYVGEIDWTDYYLSRWTRDFVLEHWREDFEYFDYEKSIP